VSRHAFSTEAEWLAFRKYHITATDAAAIICGQVELRGGVFRSALDVYADKLQSSQPYPDNPTLKRGRRLERFVAEWFIDHEQLRWQDVTVEQPGEAKVSFTCDAHQWLSCTPDLVGGEIKTARSRDGWGDAGTDQVPPGYLVQCIVNMVCLDVDEWKLIAAFSFDDIRIYTIRRDFEVELGVLSRLLEWRDKHWPPLPPPAMDGSEGGERVIAALFPQARAPRLLAQPGDALDRAMAMLRVTRDRLEAVEALEAKASQEARLAVGDHDAAAGPYWSLTYRNNKDGEKVDWQGVAGDFQRALAAATNEADAGFLAERLRAMHATVKPGARVFRPTFK
jgi:predicted phage-related endonuclease